VPLNKEADRTLSRLSFKVETVTHGYKVLRSE